MKLKIRIFLSLLIMISILYYFFADFIKNEMGKQYIESIEESLIDTAHILAALVELNLREGKLETKQLTKLFNKTAARELDARIYELKKSRVDINVYVTDHKGIVIYDSNNGFAVGRDYSQWNDVYLTLRGQYGARLSLVESPAYARAFSRQENRAIESFYIGAPITHANKIIGVLSVVKSKESINQFINLTKERMFLALLLAFSLTLIFLFILSNWITVPIARLIAYVRAIKNKPRLTLPALGKSEIRELGLSFEELLDQLEGKKYIEKYVQTLTHELKGPLSSIKGAAELLEEKMPVEQRAKFLKNIQAESLRIENLVSRMLELAALESRKELSSRESICIFDLFKDVIASLSPRIKKKNLSVKCIGDQSLCLTGERFLIRHSLANLLENAIKFSYPGGEIKLDCEKNNDFIVIHIRDQGTGIPEFAREKIFNRFYSIPPQNSAQKSTGLGLAFVKEVICLHNGQLTVKNNDGPGVTAALYFPILDSFSKKKKN